MERKSTPDLLKGIAVVLMVQVHLMELFAQQGLYLSNIGKVSLFLGGPPAAPIFMAVMGYFLAISAKNTSKMVFRGFKLLLWGLLLNIGLNLHLIFDHFTEQIQVNPFEYIFGVDILFLAGLSLIAIAFLRPIFKDNFYLWGGMAVVIVLITPLFSYIPLDPSWKNYPIAYFGGNFSWSYFPLFPWLAYPIAGYTFSLLEKPILENILTRKRILSWTALAGLIIIFTISQAADITHQLELYYHHGIVFFLWTLLFIGFWSAIFMLVNERFPDNPVFNYFKWTGKNVTRFYVFQWLIIGNLGTYLYKSQNNWQLLLWFCLIITLTSIFVYSWSKQKEKRKYDIL